MASKKPSKSIEYQEEKGALKADSSEKSLSALPVAGRFAVRPRGNQLVFGVVKTAEDKPAPKDTVIRVLNQSLGKSQVLGTTNPVEGNDEDGVEAGSYRILYALEATPGSDDPSANIQVVAENAELKLRAESKIHFRAEPRLEVNLALQPIEKFEPDTLYEKFWLRLEPLLDGIAPADLTSDHEKFLLNELGDEPLISSNLVVFIAAAKLAEILGSSIEAMFALGHGDHGIAPLTLEQLLQEPSSKLRRVWGEKILDKTIPDITAQIDTILQGLEAQQFRTERLRVNEFVGRLLAQESNHPLVGFKLEVRDAGEEESARQDLGEVETGPGGYFRVSFSHLSDVAETAVRHLSLRISNPAGEELTQIMVGAKIKTDAVETIRIALPDEAPSPFVREFVSSELLAKLTAMNVIRLYDVFKVDEIEKIEDTEEGQALMSRAKWHRLGESDPQVFEAIRSAGYTGVLEVGDENRVRLMKKLGDTLGTMKTAELHVKAQQYQRVMENAMAEARLRWGISVDEDPGEGGNTGMIEIPRFVLPNCDCKDCNSAVSPLAYLADLLKYTIKHLEDNGDGISLSFLENLFHQPFGQLPASCDSVKAEISQVFLCCEVLWAFNQTFADPGGVTTPDPVFDQAYLAYRRESYERLLSQFGLSFEELRLAVVVGGESQAQLSERLGIAPTHLPELLRDIHERPLPITEDILEDLFGYGSTRREPLTNTPVSKMEKWRKAFLVEQWQKIDWAQDAYREDAPTLPVIDPVILTVDYFRHATAGNPAFDLFAARLNILESHSQTLEALIPLRGGLLDVGSLIAEEWNQPLNELRVLYKNFQLNGRTEVFDVRLQKMGIDLAGFTRLMTIEQQAQSQILPEEAREELRNLLVRHRLVEVFPEWIEEEQRLGLHLSPQHFWFPLSPPTDSRPWLGSMAERNTWEEALRKRMKSAIIDPHHLVRAHLHRTSNDAFEWTIVGDDEPMLELWEERKAWAASRTNDLQSASLNHPTTREALDAVLLESVLGGGLGFLEGLITESRSGVDMTPRLSQLTMDYSDFSYLTQFYESVIAEVDLSLSEWRETVAVLLNIEKRRLTQVWKQEEREKGVTLRPALFSLYHGERSEDSRIAQWLIDEVAHQEWQYTLQARIDQLNSIPEALRQSASEVEEVMLPQLRDALIRKVPFEHDSHESKADVLTKRFLIDMNMDGCMKTTRVSQAIETIQLLMWGIWSHELNLTFPDLSMENADDFEEAWKWFQSYANWKSAMFVFLYPSLYLSSTLREQQSHGFKEMVKQLSSQPTPEEACQAARFYSAYFQDICNLDLQVTCQVKVPIPIGEPCQTSGPIEERIYMFGLSSNSYKVYYSSVNAYNENQDTQDSWRPVPDLEGVIAILGAVPHITHLEERVLLLFVKSRNLDEISLQVISLSLDSLAWGLARGLDLPPGGERDFTAITVQKRLGKSSSNGIFPILGISNSNLPTNDTPTVLAIRIPDGTIFLPQLTASATEWKHSEWTPLFGNVLAKAFVSVCAFIQRTPIEYVLILRKNDGSLHYRMIYFPSNHPDSRDDGLWIKLGDIGQGEFRGAFVWPKSVDVYVYWWNGTKLQYVIIQETGKLIETGNSNAFIDYRSNLLQRAGIDLKAYKVTFSFPSSISFGVQPDGGGLAGADEVVEGYEGIIPNFDFDGNLHDFLELSNKDIEEYYSFQLDEGLEIVGDANTRIKKYWIDHTFEADFAEISQSSFLDRKKGPWKIADIYTQFFSLDGISFLQAIHKIVNAEPSINPLIPRNIVPFKQRDIKSEVNGPNDLPVNWEILFSNGEEDTIEGIEKTLIFKDDRSFYRMLVRRTGDTLQASQKRKVMVTCSGPFDLVPNGQEQQRVRKNQIAGAYRELYGADLEVPQSTVSYLYEAFHAVPMFCGTELHTAGYFEEALKWFRLVYDDRRPLGKRKIDYWLKQEEELETQFVRQDGWEGDPINSHAIASTRRNAYTRYCLISIIRCYLDLADSLFTIDTIETNAQARGYYQKALDLLDTKELDQSLGICKQTIGTLNIEVAPEWKPLFETLKTAAASVDNSDRVHTLVSAMNEIRNDETLDTQSQFRRMKSLLHEGLGKNETAPTLTAKAFSHSKEARVFERQILAQPSLAKSLGEVTGQRTHQYRRAVAVIAEKPESELDDTATAWLKLPIENTRLAVLGDNGDLSRSRVLTLLNPSRTTTRSLIEESHSPYLRLGQLTSTSTRFASKSISFPFCIPPNPVLSALRLRAENNLRKLRTCRNIAGIRRDVDPYAVSIAPDEGLPGTSRGRIQIQGRDHITPPIYRYSELVRRAKELVSLAQQLEGHYIATLQAIDTENLSRIQAEQGMQLANSREQLQRVRIQEANHGVDLATVQHSSSIIRQATFDRWISQGQNQHERNMVQAYKDAGEAQRGAAQASAAAAAFSASIPAATPPLGVRKVFPWEWGEYAVRAAAAAAATASHLAAGVFNVQAISAQMSAQINSALASFERRDQEWRLQEQLAQQDILIGNQQIILAQDHLAIVNQEHAISQIESQHAMDVLHFLMNKTLNLEVYRWMSVVFRDIYRYFLQAGTAMAKLAENAAAFAGQTGDPGIIQDSYWVSPRQNGQGRPGRNNPTDGLTGSVRLLTDVHKLDQYVFETKQRKLQISKTLDLALLFPFEFQEFRESGVLEFTTPMELFDRDFPGHYLRLIERVSLSIVAVVSPTLGVLATLDASSTSKLVVSRFGSLFQPIIVRTEPEQMAFTSTSATSGTVPLQPESPEFLNTFEGSGVDRLWKLTLPKASNQFNFNTMATVLFTIEYSALNSFDYRQQVIQRLNRTVQADRAFSFRHEFPDPWYDLNNPDQTSTPMVVGFDTRPQDFPPNLMNVRIEHVVLYFVKKDGIEAFPVAIDHLHFQEQVSGPPYGGSAQSIDCKVSTRFGNGVNWLSLVGRQPFGRWELSLTDSQELRSRFAQEEITDILFVLSYRAETPPWPQ